jgi:hypothetical protein
MSKFSSKAQLPQLNILKSIVLTLGAIAVIMIIGLQLIKLSEAATFWWCSLAASGRDISIRTFLTSENLAMKSVGEALMKIPLLCGIKTSTALTETKTFDKVSKSAFLSLVSEEAEKCWEAFLSGEGDFAYKIRNPYTCSIMTLDLKEKVSMSELKDEIAGGSEFYCTRGEYFINETKAKEWIEQEILGRETCVEYSTEAFCNYAWELAEYEGAYKCSWEEVA